MANKVTIRNRTAHMKQLQLGGGRSITIPPTAEGMPGLAVTFDSDENAPILSRRGSSPASAASSAARSGPPPAASPIATISAPDSRQGRMLEWCS